MLFIWFVFAVVSLSYSDEIIIKTATSNPLHPSSDGVVTSIITPSDVLLAPHSWSIDVKTEFNFQLHLGIDSSFGFHPNTTSTLQITVNSNVSMPTEVPATDRDILFSFVVSDQCFTAMLRMDNAGNNWIYPLCDTNMPPSTQMMSDIDDHLYETLAFSNSTTEEQYADMKPVGQNINEFPIIFTITNDPINDFVLFEYKNPSMDASSHYQQCGFSPSFDTEQGLNVFIAGSDYGVTFDISSVDVAYSYTSSSTANEPTVAPTIPYNVQSENEIDNWETSVLPSSTPTQIAWNDYNERNGDVNTAQNTTTDPLVYILIVCVCILCLFASLMAARNWLCANDDAPFVNKRMRVNTSDDNVEVVDAMRMQMTGAIEYNFNGDAYNKCKDEQSDPNDGVEVQGTTSDEDESSEHQVTNMTKLGAVISIDLD